MLDRYGVTRAEADRAVWSIDSQGTQLEGAAAINRVLDELGAGWSALAAAYRHRPLAAIEEGAYRWFAPRRTRFQRLGIRPACDEPDARCT